VTEDTLPDASEYETAIVSPVSLPDMWKVVKIGQKPGLELKIRSFTLSIFEQQNICTFI